MKTFEDILYEEREGVAHVTINRPKVYNAFRAQTVEELIEAIKSAGWNRDIGVIVLEGIYLLKRAFVRHYDLSIWIECSFETAHIDGLPSL